MDYLSTMASVQVKDTIENLNRISQFREEHVSVCQELSAQREKTEKDHEELLSIIEEQEEIEKVMNQIPHPSEGLQNSLGNLNWREKNLKEKIEGNKEVINKLIQEETHLQSVFESDHELLKEKWQYSHRQIELLIKAQEDMSELNSTNETLKRQIGSLELEVARKEKDKETQEQIEMSIQKKIKQYTESIEALENTYKQKLHEYHDLAERNDHFRRNARSSPIASPENRFRMNSPPSRFSQSKFSSNSRMKRRINFERRSSVSYEYYLVVFGLVIIVFLYFFLGHN